MDLSAIQDLARLIGSPVPAGNKRNVSIACPMAARLHRGGEDRNPSLSVKVEPAAQSPAICWTCKTQGTVLSVFESANDKGAFSEAVQHIQEAEKNRLIGAFSRGAALTSTTPDNFGYWGRYVQRCASMVPQYLIDRGLVWDDIHKWRLGYDQELGRAVFPIWNEDGDVVGATRRACFDQHPKWLATSKLPKEEVFYGENYVDTTRGEVYLVEGALDVIIASRVIPNVIGNLGTSVKVTPIRLEKLRRWARTVYLMFHGDEAGWQAVHGVYDDHGELTMRGLADTLRPYFIVKVVELPEGWTPDLCLLQTS